MHDLEGIIRFLEQNWLAVVAIVLALIALFKPTNVGLIKEESNILSTSIKRNPSTFQSTFQQVEQIKFDSSEPRFSEVMQALQSGNKILAIKIIREAKGLDLTTAKMLVEALESFRK